MISEQVIQDVAKRLEQAAPESTIILFGSYARGEAREGSDLDILVIEPVVKHRRREMVRLSDAVRPLRVPVDIVVASRKVFDAWCHTPGTILYEAAKEGRVLHAAA